MAKSRVQELDLEAESRTLGDFELEDRRINFKKVNELKKMASLNLNQKSRVKWLWMGMKT